MVRINYNEHNLKMTTTTTKIATEPLGTVRTRTTDYYKNGNNIMGGGGNTYISLHTTPLKLPLQDGRSTLWNIRGTGTGW